MIKYILISILLILGLNSCYCTYSYGVYVENATGENLTIAFKSTADERGAIEDTISLFSGERKLIIKNAEIFPGGDCSGTSPGHCSFVAEYVQAFLRDTLPSKLEWCDESISFEKMDIQEAEFILKYTIDDF